MTGVTLAAEPDLGQMQRDRGARLQVLMAERTIDTLVLMGNSNVAYATGARWPLADAGRAHVERPIAVVVAGDPIPHLFTPYRERSEAGSVPLDHLHGPVYLEFDEGVATFAGALAEIRGGAGGRVAVDELPGPIQRSRERLFGTQPPAGADDLIGAAKLTKTPDELGFLRAALKITEEAIADVQAAVAPGVRQIDLTARFLHRVFELGADANILDPIWQVMPACRADGPWTTHGDIACPLLTTERALVEGDVLWVDTGISYAGFASDFGRTWVVGDSPTPRQRDQFTVWHEIIDAVLALTRPGTTGADLTRAAREVSGDARPWMQHFYLGHGLGVESAEPPFIGTDLGDAYDAGVVLQEGMVLVLEPLIWQEGASGYRAEEVIAITDDGYIRMTDYPYDPYAD